MIRNGDAGVSIVSFGNAHRLGQGQEHAFYDEDRSLSRLLPNPLLRAADGGPTDSFKEAFPIASTSNIQENKSDSSSPLSPAKKAKTVKRGTS